MDFKHLGAIIVGAACITVGALVPATAPVLVPLGGGLLLVSNPRKIMAKSGHKQKPNGPTK